MTNTELTKEQFSERFVARMLQIGGPKFDNGDPVEEYAKETAPSYWETDYQREEGPEACADSDMDHWGE